MDRWRALLPALVVASGLLGAHVSGCRVYRSLELRADDFRLTWRPQRAADARVVIVAIDDTSIEHEGRWPWSRARMAELVRKLAAYQPRAVGFDIVQSEASPPEAGGKAADEALARALGELPRAVLGYFLDFTRESAPEERVRLRTYDRVRVRGSDALEWLPPRVARRPRVTSNLPLFQAAAADAGYFNFVPDVDGTIRRVPLALRYGDEIAVPLALATLRQALGQPLFIEVSSGGVRFVRIGDSALPVDRSGFLRIDFHGPPRTFVHIPATDVLQGRVPPERLRDKIVLVGVTATAVYDLRVTPFSPVFPGVEIHATVIDNVLQGRFLWSPGWGEAFAVLAIVGFALLVALVLARMTAARAALACLAVAVAYVAIAETLLRQHGCVLPVLGPSLAIGLTFATGTLQRYVWEERERRRLRKALELYLSPAAAAYVAEHPQALHLGGEKRECTVLFSDLRGFTAMSEALPAEQLVELLNVYLGAMTEVVFEHDGMLDKYMGDGLMALWGAPLPSVHHARQACAAALAMRERLAQLCQRWRERGWPQLALGVGINTGPMVFGNLGSAEHLSLTVVGDNVNLASRLEGLNKRYGTTILASEETVRQAGNQLLVREIDWVRVKGRQQPVRVFEVLGVGDVAQRRALESLARRFEAALACYRQRHWGEALESFREILRDYPADGPAAVFAQRCEQYLRQAPGPEWSPITHVEEK